MTHFRKVLFWVAALVLLFIAGLFLLSLKSAPKKIIYGVSFNTPYAWELGLNPREVYTDVLDDLGVRHLRLAAHWSMVEAERDRFDFSELDYQISEAEKRGAEVILGVGRRLPRWPECHVPRWVHVQTIRPADSTPYVLQPNRQAGRPNSASIGHMGSTSPPRQR